MTTPLQNIMRNVMATVKRDRGVLVSYTQNVTIRANITAIPGESKWPAENASGLVVEIESRDWLIEVVDMGRLVPASGDVVVRNDGVTIRTFNVVPPTPTMRPYSEERNGTWYRVHTKLISEVAFN